VSSVLVDGEECAAASRPDRATWVLDNVIHLLSVLVCLIVFVALLDGGGPRAFLGGLGTLVVCAWYGVRFCRMWCTRYLLTSHRVMRVSGVVRRDLEFMTWSKVTDVSIERSLADRLTRTATIRVHSANEQSSFKVLSDVLYPVEFAEEIARRVNARSRF
jgi:uncharacterized membrane protein YdbT with pleckstrin-like domain